MVTPWKKVLQCSKWFQPAQKGKSQNALCDGKILKTNVMVVVSPKPMLLLSKDRGDHPNSDQG